jgi:V8-like Glu-specific endopeptidase
VINPDIFLEEDDISPLHRVLLHFAEEVGTYRDRFAFFQAAGLPTTLNTVHFDVTAPLFTTELIGWFRNARVLDRQPNFHPLVTFLKYLSEAIQLDGEEEYICRKLLVRGRTNLLVISARSAVGRVEAPEGKWVGTGVYVGDSMILTCYHVLTAAQGKRSIRFGYRMNRRINLPDQGVVFEIEPVSINYNVDLDIALLKLKGQPGQSPAVPYKKVLDCNQRVYLIHHPNGQPVEVSEAGYIVATGDEFIDHTIPTKNGSSGAAIFDQNWRLVAIHRGNPSNRELAEGSSAGVPLTAFWDIISQHLSVNEE